MAAMDAVEKDTNAGYEADDMTNAIRLPHCSLLTLYLKQRLLKLVRPVREESGFAAWEILLKEIQPASRCKSRKDPRFADPVCKERDYQ